RIGAGQLKKSVKGQKKPYGKGERANLQFEVTDEQGRKTAAWIGGAVVDERAVWPADLEAPSPQTQFFLLSEIRHPEDVEQADLLLADSPEGRKSLDLFLGTQGWRRFVPANPIPEPPALFAMGKDAKNAEGIIFNRENNTPAALAALHDAKLKKSLDQLSQETARKRQTLAQEKGQHTDDARLAAVELARFQNVPANVLRIAAGFVVLALVIAGVLLLVWGLVCVQRRVSPT